MILNGEIILELFNISGLFFLTAHVRDEQHKELRVPSVWASHEFARLTGKTSSHPLRGPPLQLCRLWRMLHRYQQLKQVSVIFTVDTSLVLETLIQHSNIRM